MFHRLPRVWDRLVRNLKTVLKREEDLPVLAQVVLQLQTLLKKRFGLRCNFDEGEVVGDVEKAVAKARKAVRWGGRRFAAKVAIFPAESRGIPADRLVVYKRGRP